ncbi:GGDEF domain-containing protein (plasmid) [Deinococcus sp. KNUC1210]|uniref:GGDEF domain-containing protein n=1 Tax=Deinococcus sp. KNUC1210 TaxID=2917691 RepID=UPI001EF14925|nr:GGDEF domain-containing protein [Deinococcus sp. KNUC1210]ULH13845.1 GGDEF domain-containing protein [Deinococcus sp. KNUC1210]
MVNALSASVILDVLVIPNLAIQSYTAFLLCSCLVLASIYLAAGQLVNVWKDKLGGRKKSAVRSRDVFVDAMTGLPNRVASEKYFALHVDQTHQSAAIIVLDIDNFRTINDTLGYSKGDDVLKRFAQYLKNKCGSAMHVARLSGDEFIIIASGLDDLKAFKLVSDISDYIKSKDSSITVFDGEKKENTSI